MTKLPPAEQNARPYVSSVRQARAHDTRRRILATAQEQFIEHGYATTSLAAIADRAGVSADTVYKVFGSKIGLLKELLDVVIAGDDERIAVLDRTGPQQIRSETNALGQLHLLAQGVTAQLERIRPVDDILRSAAAVDRQAAELRRDIQDRQRHDAMKTIVSWLDEAALRPEQKRGDRADTVWALTSPEMHDLLRTRRRWSAARYATWLESMLVHALLD